jgi:hypothetical protein
MQCKFFDIRGNSTLDFSFCMFLEVYTEENFYVIHKVYLSTSYTRNGGKEANIVDLGPR